MQIAYRLSKMIAFGGLLAWLSLAAGAGPAQADGTPKWKKPFPVDCRNSSPAVGKDGTIYAGDWDSGTFYAIKPDGTQLWQTQLAGDIECSPAIGKNLEGETRIYVGSKSTGGGGRLYSIRNDGSIDWYVGTVGKVTSCPAISPKGYLWWGCHGDYPDHNSRLYCARPFVDSIDTGTISPVQASPAYVSINGVDTIYVGVGGYLCAYKGDLELIWKSYIGSQTSSPAIDRDGNIYVGSFDQACLYAFDPKGNVKWDTKAYTTGSVQSPPTVDWANGPIYVGCDDYYVYAFGSKGQQLWKFQADYPVSSAPTLGSDGLIYVVSHRGTVYALFADDGSQYWKYETGGQCDASPALAPDGTLYVPTSYGLYAFDTGSNGLRGAAWPMFHQSLDHAGRQRLFANINSIIDLILYCVDKE